MSIFVILRPRMLRPPTTLPLEDHNYALDRAIDLIFAPFNRLYHVDFGTNWLNDLGKF